MRHRGLPSTVAGVSFSTFVRLQATTVITFLELRIQKKSEKRPQKWARNSDPFLVPLSIGIFPEGSENGRILGPAFWCWRTTFELIFGIAQSGRGATISLATCSRRTPKCSQLMLALNTYSFQTIKLKTCCILTKRSANSTVAGVSFSTFVRLQATEHCCCRCP